MSTPEKTTTAARRASGGPAVGATAVLDAPVAGATDVVEALTTEAAIAEVHQRLGPDARILDARRVLRGGIGGFFAKEHVQLHVAPGEPVGGADRLEAGRPSAPSADRAAVATTTDTTPGATTSPQVARPAGFNPWAQVAADEAGAMSPVDRLLAQADEVPDEGPRAVDFATFLRDQLGPDAGSEGASAPVVGPAAVPLDPSSGLPADLADATADGRSRGPVADDQLARPSWPRVDIDSVRLVGGTAVQRDGDEQAAAAAPVPTEPASAAAPTPGTDPTPAGASAEALLAALGSVAPAPAAAAPVQADPTPVVTAAPAPVAAPAAVATTSMPDLLHREPAPAQDGGPAWSVPALLALGLPVELVRSLRVDEPSDDIAWTMALAEALRPSCRPLPDGPAVFVGPCADGFAQVDDAPVARSETWLAALRPGRWVHLVVGGDGWRRSLDESPLAASWAEPEDLPDAIRCAVELGLVLGYGPYGADMRRARPLDVALAVRDMVVNR